MTLSIDPKSAGEPSPAVIEVRVVNQVTARTIAGGIVQGSLWMTLIWIILYVFWYIAIRPPTG